MERRDYDVEMQIFSKISRSLCCAYFALLIPLDPITAAAVEQSNQKPSSLDPSQHTTSFIRGPDIIYTWSSSMLRTYYYCSYYCSTGMYERHLFISQQAVRWMALDERV